MAALYYYSDPRPFHSFEPLQPSSSLDYWFYPSKDNPQHTSEQHPDKKKDEKKGEKKVEKQDETKENKKDEKKDDKKGGEKPNEKKDDNKSKTIELKVPLCCESCARKVRKRLERLDGVQKPVICDLYLMKVTVTATAKQDVVLKTVQKVKKDAEIWTQQKK